MGFTESNLLLYADDFALFANLISTSPEWNLLNQIPFNLYRRIDLPVSLIYDLNTIKMNIMV